MMVGLITQNKSYNYKKEFYDDAIASSQEKDKEGTVEEKKEYTSNPLTLSVIRQESSGDEKAVSSKGNAGLMQIGKSVLREYNDRMGTDLTEKDLFDPEINVNIGEWYLQMRIPEMLDAKGLPVNEKNIIWAYRAGVESVASGKMPKNIKDYVNAILNREK